MAGTEEYLCLYFVVTTKYFFLYLSVSYSTKYRRARYMWWRSIYFPCVLAISKAGAVVVMGPKI